VSPPSRSERNADGSARSRCVIEEVASQGLALINWESDDGTVAIKARARSAAHVLPHRGARAAGASGACHSANTLALLRRRGHAASRCERSRCARRLRAQPCAPDARSADAVMR
jgi:hypothetical protein